MPTYTWRNVAKFILRVSEVRPDGKDVYIFTYVNIYFFTYIFTYKIYILKYISRGIYFIICIIINI